MARSASSDSLRATATRSYSGDVSAASTSPKRRYTSASVLPLPTGHVLRRRERASPLPLPLQSAALSGGFAVGQLPARSGEVAGVAVRVALEVVLVLGLGLPERDGLADLGHHLAGPQSRGLDIGDRV